MPDRPTPLPADLLPRDVRWSVVLGLFCLFTLVRSQGRGSVDEEFLYRTTYSAVHCGSLRFPDLDLPVDADVESQRRVASKFGVLPSLAAVPFHLAGLVLCQFAPESLGDDVVRVATYSSSALWMSLAALYLAGVLACMRLSHTVQLGTVLLFALATPAVVYAQFFHVTAMATLLIAALLHAAVKFDRRPAVTYALHLGIWLGLLLLVGFNFIVLLPIVVLFVLRASDARRGVNVAATAAPVLASWALVIVVNLLRGHHWLRGGYVGEAFVTPLAFGLYGLLFSAGRGLFFYSPLSAAGLLVFPTLWRKRRRLAWLAVSIFFLVAVSYAKWFAWNGGTYWGPRYLIPVVPLTLVPLACYLSHWNDKSVLSRSGFLVLCLAAAAVQVRGVRTHYYAATAQIAGLVHSENELHFVPQLQPLWWQADTQPALLWVQWYQHGHTAIALVALLLAVPAVLGLGYAVLRVGLWRAVAQALPPAAWLWLLGVPAALLLWQGWRSVGHGLERNRSMHTLPPVDFDHPRWTWRSPTSATTKWGGYLRVPQNGDYALFFRSAGPGRLSLKQESGPEVTVLPRLDHPGGPQWERWAGRLNVGLYELQLDAGPGPAGHAEVSLLWTMHGAGVDRQPIDPQYLYPHRPSALRMALDRALGISWLLFLTAGLLLLGRSLTGG